MNCSRARRLLLLLTIVPPFLSGFRLFGQVMAGSVSGIVICNDDNTPARGATVSLIPIDQLLTPGSPGAASAPLSTDTDFSGTYEFESVRPGTYLAHVTMNGYTDGMRLVLSSLDKVSAEEKKKELAAFPQIVMRAGGATRKDLFIHRAASISGRALVDIGGTPGRVRVTATRISDEGLESGGAPSMGPFEPIQMWGDVDDRGAYRIAGLPAGKYRLSLRIVETYFAAKPDESNMGRIRLETSRPGIADLTVYAPDALDKAKARIVEVKDGDETTDADITVPTRLLHSIAGIVTMDGAPQVGISVSVQRLGGPRPGSDAITMQDGAFRFDLLPSGTYTLHARLWAGSTAKTSGESTVTLQDSDIVDANIELHSVPVPPR